jgi:hypothetical protein
MVDLLEANVFAAEGVADVDPASVPAKAAVAADESSLEVAGVLERRELARVGSVGRHVERRGRLLTDGFAVVRALVVVHRLEVVEASLLGYVLVVVGHASAARRPGRHRGAPFRFGRSADTPR